VSFSAIFIRLADDDPATIVWLRMSMAAVLLLPFAARRGREVVHRGGPARWAITLASGALLAAHFLLWTASLQYTSVAASVLLVSVHPLVVIPLGRRLLGDSIPSRAVVGAVLAIAGTVITCAADVRVDQRALIGDLMALGGALSLAGYLLIGRRVRAQTGVAAYSMSVYAVVAVAAATVAVAEGRPHFASPRVALLCLALAVVCTLGGHTVYNWALRHVRAATISIAFLGEPPLAAVLALLILGAVPSAATITGGVLILIGLGVTLFERQAQPGSAGATALP